jgi:predicted phosphoadenosine phosphosulfate sulfurtransferase
MEKIEAYVETWETRCYSDGIPDEIPESLSKALRAPSYKSIALCLLRNDRQLKGLGFHVADTELVQALKSKDIEKLI